MTETVKALSRNEKLAAESLLYTSMLGARETNIKWLALGLAIVLHAVVLLINFPEFRSTATPEKRQTVLIVKKYIPPPPPIQRNQLVRKKITRMVPIPDPTPEEPEPIREPEPTFDYQPIPADVEILIGVPEPPPLPSQTLVAGVGDVTNPELIGDSKIDPLYPEMARVARVEGNVVLQAIVRQDGSVGDLHVLRSNRPMMGFEEAAIAAVQQWRYEPATQNGRPVDVYFTVFVEFSLI